MIRKWAVLAIVVVVVGVGSYAGSRAYVESKQPAVAADPAVAALEKSLELTGKQQDAMARIDSHYAPKREALRTAVWAARDELVSLLQDPSSTRDQAVSAAQALGRAQEAMQANTVEYIYEVRRLLNDSQKQRLSELVGRGMCSTEGRCGLGGGGFGGGRRWRGGRGL